MKNHLRVALSAKYVGLAKSTLRQYAAITTSFSARIYGKRGGKKAAEQIKYVIDTSIKEE